LDKAVLSIVIISSAGILVVVGWFVFGVVKEKNANSR